MNLRDIARLRVASQMIARPVSGPASDVVTALGAVQAQDNRMAIWAVGLRLQDSSAVSVRRAIDRGEIIRTHVLRPTWHLIPARDARWMLELTAPHLIASLRGRHRSMGITERDFARAGALLERELQGKAYRTREELIAVMGKARLPVEEYRGWHLLLRAELDGIICSGPLRDGRPTCALLEERIRPTRKLPREEALATLARRYFTGHAPASIEDFRWWSGLPAADARSALEMVQPDFEPVMVGKRTYWNSPGAAASGGRKGTVAVLPAYDEFIISYRDRSASLAGVKESSLVSRNGIFYPAITVDGEVVGTWKRETGEGPGRIEGTLFRHTSAPTTNAIRRAFAGYARFEGRPMDVGIRTGRRVT